MLTCPLCSGEFGLVRAGQLYHNYICEPCQLDATFTPRDKVFCHVNWHVQYAGYLPVIGCYAVSHDFKQQLTVFPDGCYSYLRVTNPRDLQATLNEITAWFRKQQRFLNID